MPSLMEGFGLVFLEAMAQGLPVIGGNVGGTLELIRDGVNGFLVNPGDVAEGEIITTPLGTATFVAIAPVTPEQSAPIIATTPPDTKPSAAEVAAAESTHVESALSTEIF